MVEGELRPNNNISTGDNAEVLGLKLVLAVTIRSCDAAEQYTVTTVHIYSVMIMKSGRMRGVRHVVQIEGTEKFKLDRAWKTGRKGKDWGSREQMEEYYFKKSEISTMSGVG